MNLKNLMFVMVILLSTALITGCRGESQLSTENVATNVSPNTGELMTANVPVETAEVESDDSDSSKWRKMSLLCDAAGKPSSVVVNMLGKPNRNEKMSSIDNRYHYWQWDDVAGQGFPDGYQAVVLLIDGQTNRIETVRIFVGKLGYPNFLKGFVVWMNIRYDPMTIYTFASKDNLDEQGRLSMSQSTEFKYPLTVETKLLSGKQAIINCVVGRPTVDHRGNLNSYLDILGSDMAINDILISAKPSKVHGKVLHSGRVY